MRQPRAKATQKYLGRLVAAGLVTGAASHALADDALKPNQAVSTNTPPKSPEKFNPDANAVTLPEPVPTDFRWTRPVTISTNPPPAANFNPDPGATLIPPTNAPAPLFDEPTAPPVFTPPPVPMDLSLPRNHARISEIQPPGNNPPDVISGYEPLPDDQTLPRQNVRRELRIDQDFNVPDYPLRRLAVPDNTVAVPDRWHVGFTPWKRYTSGSIEDPYNSPGPFLWYPYQQSLLKGDLPIIGQNIFLDLTASTETITEFRRVPTASGVSTAVPGEYEFYGQSDELSIQNNLALSFLLFQGETAFRPMDWAIKLEPVYNVNYLEASEAGVVSPDPRGFLGANNSIPPNNGFVWNPGNIGQLLNGQTGPANSYRAKQSTQRTRTYFSLQQGFVEVHLTDLSENYDFISLRVGNQPFNADFRGFLFNDVNLGARLFGNYDNNLYQYNLAVFDMREKDTDSELNTFDARDQDVVIANLYRQDFIWPGYTAEWSFLANYDRGGLHYDRNGNIARPEPLGTARVHDESIYYLGWGGDGHIGRLNLSHQFYEALGRDDFNGLAGKSVGVDAQMAALELSYDHDWARYKATFFYASGDSSATDSRATGFDTVVDNPNFIGGPFSYWARQGFNLGGTLVNLKSPGSLVPDLRTSKTEGQANFVNPGVFIYGLGAEFDVTPKLRSFLNANYIRFANTDTIKTALLTDKVNPEVGWDLSLGFQYRPLLTDNIIFSAGFGVLIPGEGFDDIYRTMNNPVPGLGDTAHPGAPDDFLYSGLIALTLTY